MIIAFIGTLLLKSFHESLMVTWAGVFRTCIDLAGQQCMGHGCMGLGCFEIDSIQVACKDWSRRLRHAAIDCEWLQNGIPKDFLVTAVAIR